MTALVQAEEAGDRLSEDERVGMIMLLLFAGYETTVHLIASGSLTLIQHPEQRRRFQETPALAESAIEELLRYTSPADFASPRPPRILGTALVLAGIHGDERGTWGRANMLRSLDMRVTAVEIGWRGSLLWVPFRSTP